MTGQVAHIYTVTFFDFEGRKLYPGGAERYILDLAKIFSDRGIKTRVFQAGTTHWRRKVKDIEVIALPWPGSIYELSKIFGNETQPGCINIYSPFTLTVANLHKPNIGICHGVYWDQGVGFNGSSETTRDVLSSILHADLTVSVDTNSINFIRAIRPQLAERMIYVPNYVRDDFFANPTRKEGITTIIYPRRLYTPRGYWLAAEAARTILNRRMDINFLFIGDADPKERDDVQRLTEEFPGRAAWHCALPHEMPGWYAQSDIAIIPTVHSEGTSLSALEALAAGNAVISTDVGGLTNIIINEFNGLMIAPDGEALRSAIERLIDDRAMRKRLVEAGQQTARAFSHAKWQATWENVLGRSGVQANSAAKIRPIAKLPKIVHPRTDGIIWSVSSGTNQLPAQRPHHLMQALGSVGLETMFISDTAQVAPQTATASASILGRGVQIYENSVIYYIYYAYQMWALGKKGFDFVADIAPELRSRFTSQEEVHDVDQALVWFDLIDDPSLHKDSVYEQAVEYFLKHADIVSTTSRLLHSSYSRIRPDIILIENACWPHHFLPSEVERPVNIPAPAVAALQEVRTRGRKIVGYFGAIASWFDFALLKEAASERFAEEFFLFGPISPDVEHAVSNISADLPNIHFLGPVPYHELASLLNEFDVAILPFLSNPITNATNPIKIYEYLAGGCPVITTNLVELNLILKEHPTAAIRVCNDSTEFVNELSAMLDGSRAEIASLSRSARAFATNNTWLHRAVALVDNIDSDFIDKNMIGISNINHWSVHSLNTIDEGRVVPCAADSVDSKYVFRLVEGHLTSGDRLVAETPIYVAEAGFYRFLLTVEKNYNNPEGRGFVDISLFIAGREIFCRDLAGDYNVIHVIAIIECGPGLHSVRAQLDVKHSTGDWNWGPATSVSLTELNCTSSISRREGIAVHPSE